MDKLAEFLRQSLLIFIIKGFLTIFFIFIVISRTFRPICPTGHGVTVIGVGSLSF